MAVVDNVDLWILSTRELKGGGTCNAELCRFLTKLKSFYKNPPQNALQATCGNNEYKMKLKDLVFTRCSRESKKHLRKFRKCLIFK